ncbi:MAG: PAS domain S-box protein [Caldilineaceae bacterium]
MNEQLLLFGMTPQDHPMATADFFRHVHPADRFWLGATVQAAIDERRVYQAEFRICKEDGSPCWMSGYGRVVAEENGQPTQMSGVMFDITERKEAEEALRASEARQTIILETMAEGVVTIDRDGRFLSVNAAAERILGVSRSELIGVSIMAPPFRRFAQDGEPWGQHPPLAEVAAAGNRVFHHDYVIERRDGSRVTISRNITALRTPDGALLGFVSTLSDITEQQRMEASLRNSEERFRAVANLVPDLLWSNDPAGMTDWYNQRWLEYTGQTLVDATKQGWLAVLHREDRAGALHNFQSAIEQGALLRQELRLRGADGAYRWFLVQVRPMFDGADRIVRWFGAATDIHEQRMTRDMLERHVHERTHELTTVSAMRQHLLDRLLSVQEDERRRIAHDLHDSLGQHLVALNVGLKTVEEIDGCPHDISARIVALRAMVVRMDEEVERLAFALRPPALDDLGLADALRRHVAVWSADSHIPVDLHLRGLTATRLPSAVETAIFRVMQEALTNIRKYAAATHVSLILEQRAHEVVLIIEDDGCGFDVAAALATAGRRLHLGLSGMRERAGLVGGQLDVESAPGAGATVYLHIPLAER